METTPLRSFATWARRELITQVSARLTAVLAPSSAERVENEGAVAKLEHDIAAAGAGTKGKAAVVDEVAYIWFNRIISLRFMDANGYTRVGVVSPQHGQAIGQPEILANAKHGTIDAAVITNPSTVDQIIGLLNGTRPSADPQGEAYTVLLAGYCRYWNRSMPFMFEPEGDYTELLIPANLLATDSILAEAAAVLTEEVCRDVEVIGWLYQFYISERKDEVFAAFKKGKKAGAAEIPAATQLFTPHWIVRYLVENSLGRLWMLNHPESRLIDQMDYYIAPVDEETDFLRVETAEELTVIDPACGSGHMLTYAFDLLYAIYEEEGYAPSEIPALILTHNLYGTEIDSRAGALAAFALSMKARSKQRTFFSKEIRPNICVLKPVSFTPDELDVLTTRDGDRDTEEAFWNQFQHADTFGALIRPKAALIGSLSHHVENLEVNTLGSVSLRDKARTVLEQARYLSRRYHVAVANPPYMGSKQMNPLLSQFMKTQYPTGKSDLFAGFIERCASLTASLGAVAMITMQSWMFLSSYEKLRLSLLSNQRITLMLHLGARAFDSIGGEVVSSTAFVLNNHQNSSQRTNTSEAGVFIRLVDYTSETEKLAALDTALTEQSKDSGYFLASVNDFKAIPGSPIVYWLSEKMRASFGTGRPLGMIADIKHGLSTGKNEAVVRLWWETSAKHFASACVSTSQAEVSGKAWFPYNSGGSFRKWYGNVEKALRYDSHGRELMASFPGHRHDGRARYFQQGVTWSKVSSGAPAFRSQPVGQVFDVAGNGFFLDNPEGLNGLLAFCNSSTAQAMLAALSPTLNFEVGQIAKLPVSLERDAKVEDAVEHLIDTARSDWDSVETSWDFVMNPLITLGRE